MRAVRFGSKLFATKTSYRHTYMTNIAKPVQAAHRVSTLFATKTAYGSGKCNLCLRQWLISPYRQTNIWNPDQTAPRRSGFTLIATKTSFNSELLDDIWVVM